MTQCDDCRKGVMYAPLPNVPPHLSVTNLPPLHSSSLCLLLSINALLFPIHRLRGLLLYTSVSCSPESGQNQGQGTSCLVNLVTSKTLQKKSFFRICQRWRSDKLPESTACLFGSRDNKNHTRRKVDKMSTIKQKDHCQGLN